MKYRRNSILKFLFKINSILEYSIHKGFKSPWECYKIFIIITRDKTLKACSFILCVAAGKNHPQF